MHHVTVPRSPMHDKIAPKIKKTSQSRSDLTKENILEAAETLFDESDPAHLNARQLSAKSGYALGTLYYYLHKAEDAFILMILRRREKHFSHLVEKIEGYPSDQPLKGLLNIIIDSSFDEYNRMNQRSFFIIFKMILRFSKNPLVFDDALSVLVPPFIECQQRNFTGTFRQTEPMEMLMLLKTCFAMIRRPFLEQHDIAGSPEHRALALDTMERLLSQR